jgi:hypothetical protein
MRYLFASVLILNGIVQVLKLLMVALSMSGVIPEGVIVISGHRRLMLRAI